MQGAEGRNDVEELTEEYRKTANLGNVVFKNAEVCIRVREDPEGIVIKIHRMICGNEYKPRGYVIGSNYLMYTPRK